jgi:hypothetical protein
MVTLGELVSGMSSLLFYYTDTVPYYSGSLSHCSPQFFQNGCQFPVNLLRILQSTDSRNLFERQVLLKSQLDKKTLLGRQRSNALF